LNYSDRSDEATGSLLPGQHEYWKQFGFPEIGKNRRHSIRTDKEGNWKGWFFGEIGYDLNGTTNIGNIPEKCKYRLKIARIK
jgi:hypothetical protein